MPAGSGDDIFVEFERGQKSYAGVTRVVRELQLAIRGGTGGQGRRGAAPAPVRVDWLGGNWPDHAGAAPVFNEYNRQVAANFTAFLKTMESRKRDSPYAGDQSCIPCRPAPGILVKLRGSIVAA